MWHDWLLYSQFSAKIKGPHALDILFKFFKTKVKNNIMKFNYNFTDDNVIMANCNIIIY